MLLVTRWGLNARFALVVGALLLGSQLNGAPKAAGALTSGPYLDLSPIEEGWQPSTVTSIAQTEDGYLWVGTYNGLLRYDGVRFVPFDSFNTVGLKSSRVTSLYADSQGALWIGHETGQLSRLVDSEFEPVPLGTSWPGGAVEAICPDENNDLWLLNAAGILFRLRDGRTAELPGGGSASRKGLLTRARSGQVWITANGTVAVLEQGKTAPLRLKGSAETDFYQAIAPAREGGAWAVINGSLRKLHEGRWEVLCENFPGPQTPVNSLLELRSGAILAGTLNDGLFVLPPGGPVLHFSRTNGLAHDWVRSVCEDHEGNVWIGTGAGLAALRTRKVRMFNPPDAWQGRAVLSFAVRSDGSACVGTEGAGLYEFQDGKWNIYNESSGLANLFVWSVLGTERGNLFVGTWGAGLLSRNGNRFESDSELSKSGAVVLALYESSQGDLWVGTTAGLYRYESGKLAWFAGKDKLVLPDVRAITETTDGTIWFGMVGGGLGSVKNDQVSQLRASDGLSSDSVQCLLAEPDGTLWIGTADNGLSRWRDGKLSNVGVSHGLPDRTISHIVDDEAGNLWMGSHAGILRVSKAELNRCADGEARFIHCSTYGLAEGLASRICSGGFQPGACRTEDGLLWFPTSKGLAIIDPSRVGTNPIKPRVRIEELRADGAQLWAELRSSALGAHPKGNPPPNRAMVLTVPPGKKRFEIQYTALSFVAPAKVRFRYKLEGLERDWSEPTTKRVAEYSYLSPGKYTFRVIACNNDEVWNEAGANLPFVVQPWFWQTWWFEGGALLAGAAGVGGAARWVTRRRVRARLEQLEQQQAIERERARIARDIHDDLGASLTRISLLSQTVRGELEGQPQAAQDVDRIYGTARELTRAMDEIVWAVNPKHDSLDSLVTYLGGFTQNFLSTAGIRCRLDVPLNLPPLALTAEIRHNVFLAFKEALNNVVKHAKASEVRVSLELQTNGFILTVADNGVGFKQSGLREPGTLTRGVSRLAAGNGLLNMSKRLEEVGGTCTLDSAVGEGTRVRLIVRFKGKADDRPSTIS